MNKMLNIAVEEVIPSIEDVLTGLGVPAGNNQEKKIIKLAEKSISLFTKLARPSGIVAEISKTEFKEVVYGEGNNEDKTPIETIFTESDFLALFIVTIGEKVEKEVSTLFKQGEYVLGSMLDSSASESAELTAQTAEAYYKSYLIESGRFNRSSAIMRFSPGYCGWHISAQKKLFDYLNPGTIDVGLNESFLMQPLKSISGVIIVGHRTIFEFNDIYSFCAECKTHSCQDRIRDIRNKQAE